MEEIEIRSLQYQDVDALCDMIKGLAAYHQDVAEISSSDVMQLCFGAHPALKVYVASDASTLVGYAALQWSVQLHFGRLNANLHHLFVVPSSRGKAVGTRLIDHVAGVAKVAGCHRLTVGADQDNHKAHRFYRGYGFSPVAREGRHFERTLRQDESLAGGDARATVATTAT